MKNSCMTRFARYFILLFALAVLLPWHSMCFAAFNGHSEAEWEVILKESGISSAPALIKKLAAANDTIQKIDSQTSSNLRIANWIEVFRKLDIQPAEALTLAQWKTFFSKAGIPAIDNIENQDTETTVLSSTASVESGAGTMAAVEPSSTQTITPPTNSLEQRATAPARQLSGEQKLISLDLKDADVFTALKIISKQTGMSLVASNNVRGTVTLFLQNVNALDALRMILEMNSLAYVLEDKVYKILTASDYERIYGNRFFDTTDVAIIKLKFAKVANLEKSLSSLRSTVGQIIPDINSNSLIVIDTPAKIQTIREVAESLDVIREIRTYSLNYAKAKDTAEKIKGAVTSGIGEVQLDERSNQLIVTDVPEKLSDIEKIILSLDKRHKEVVIEAKIIQIILSNDFKMGINWQSIFNKVNETVIAGNVSANLNALNPGAAGIRLSVGTLAVDNFSAVYDILQTVGKTNIVSSPKIASIDNQEAKILVGTKEAYVTTTVTTPGTGATSTAESVTFIDVGIKLFVTPSIGDDGYVTMKIRPEVSSVDRNLSTAQGNSIPIVRTSESETTVMVKDGVTIVIGGLMEERKEKQVSGVPLLCRIPLLGVFFGKTNYVNVKTELAVFLTPKIISGDIATGHQSPES